MSRYINANDIRKPIYAEEDNCTGIGMTFDEMDAYNDGIDAMIRQIDNVPTADVKEAVRGEWKLTPQGVIVCSHCGRQALRSYYCGIKISHVQETSNFCPHCGAKMEGEQ